MLHLVDSPRESTCRSLAFGDNGSDKMGEIFVRSELYLLRIDEYKIDLIGARFVKNTCQNRVNTYRFAHSGSTAYNKVRELCNVVNYGCAGYILTYGGKCFTARICVFVALEYLAEKDCSRYVTRYLKTYRRSARDRRLHTYALLSETERDVVVESYYGVYLYALCGGNCISYDARTAINSLDARIYVEACESFHDRIRVASYLFRIADLTVCGVE